MFSTSLQRVFAMMANLVRVTFVLTGFMLLLSCGDKRETNQFSVDVLRDSVQQPIVEIDSVVRADSLSFSTTGPDDPINYREIVEAYLATKRIIPTDFYFFDLDDSVAKIRLGRHSLSWKRLDRGIEITIDGKTINTTDKVTLNNVWGGIDSVNFANSVDEVYLHEDRGVILLSVRYTPCSGLGCSVEYYLLYNLKTRRESYFGSFSTGLSGDLYDFNKDGALDFVTTTFHGRNEQFMDTIVAVMYSETPQGDFKKFKTPRQDEFSFILIERSFNARPFRSRFKEKWVEIISP